MKKTPQELGLGKQDNWIIKVKNWNEITDIWSHS